MLFTRPQRLYSSGPSFSKCCLLLCVLYMDIRVLLPMTILLIRLSPTMCVQGDCHPLGGSTRSSSDGTLNVKLGFDLPVVVHHCTGLTRSFRLNVENIRGAQWEPDPISLCSNFAWLSTLPLSFPEIPAFAIVAFTGRPTFLPLYISVHQLAVEANTYKYFLQGSQQYCNQPWWDVAWDWKESEAMSDSDTCQLVPPSHLPSSALVDVIMLMIAPTPLSQTCWCLSKIQRTPVLFRAESIQWSVFPLLACCR